MIKRPLARNSARVTVPLAILLFALVSLLLLSSEHGGLAYKTDGRIVYGVAGTGTPKHRLWDHGASSWSVPVNAAGANTVVNWVINQASKSRLENITGVLTTNSGAGSSLYIHRWNGSSWSTAFNVSTFTASFASRRSFDISYEESSGRAMVVYSTGTNPQYRIWNGSSWTSAANVLASAESGNIEWIELTSRPGSDEIALLYAINDGSGGHTLKGIIWNGSTWGTQSAALETNLAYDTTAGDTKSFDAAYQNSGALMVVFGWNNSSNNSLAARYVTKAAGGGWGTPTDFATWADEATLVSIAAEPGGERIAAATVDSTSQDLQYGIWNGASWVNLVDNADFTLNNFSNWVGIMPVAAGWAVAGASPVAIVIYGDNAANAIHWSRWTTAGWVMQTDWNPGHSLGQLQSIDIDRQPGENKLMVSIGDTSGDLWLKTYDGTNWADTNAQTALELNLSSTFMPFDFVYDRYALTSVGDGTNPPYTHIHAGATNIAIDSFTLSTSTGVDTITGLTITGNSNFVGSNVTNVRLYRDNGSTANEWDASDTPVAAGSHTDSQVDFSGLNILADKAQKQYLIIFDLAPSAIDTTLTAQVTDVVASNAVDYGDGNDAIITVDLAPPVQVTGFNAGDGENGQSTLNWANPDSPDFHGIRIVRRDDGQYPSGPSDPAATVVFNDMTPPIATSYTDTGPLTNGATYHYTVFAHDGGLQWNTEVAPGVNADTATPGPIVNVMSTAISSGTIYQGQTGVVMQKLRLSTTFATATLSDITVNRTGTAGDAAVAAVRIYTDANDNGVIDGGDSQIGSGTFTDGAASVSLSPRTINTSGSSLLVVYDIASAAATSVTVGSTIASQASLGISGASAVSAFSNYGSNSLTINGNIVTVTNTPVAATAFKGENGVVMQRLTMSANHGTASLTNVTVTLRGTIADSRIAAVKVCVDSNANGTYDVGDTELGNGSFSSGTVNIALSPSQSITTAAKHFFVLYDIRSNASAGDTVGSRIASQASVTVSSPDTVASFSNLDSNLITVTDTANQLGVTHAAPANFSAQQGAQDNVVDVLTLSVVQGNGVTVRGLRFDELGTSYDSDITAVKLFRDTNANGVYNPGVDTELSSANVSGGRADFVFTLSVSKTASETLFVVVQPTTSARIGATALFNIANNSYVTVNSPDTVASFAPMTSAALTILDKPDTLTISQTPVDGGDVMVGTTGHVIQILDLSVNEDKVALTGLSLKRAGTALDNDTAAGGIELWYDADNNSFVSPPDWQLSASASFTGGTAAFNGIARMTITSGNPARFLVTATTRPDAVIDRTIGCSVESTASVVVGGVDTVELSAAPLESLLHALSPRAPSATTGLSVTAKYDRQVTLDWSDNNASEYITKYNVYRAVSGGEYVRVGEAPSSAFNDTVPSDGVYSYKISAVNRIGESIKGAPAQAERVDFTLTIPDTGTTQTVTSSDGAIEVEVPPAYANTQLTVRTEAKPAGPSSVSEYYATFATDASQPFDPPLSITLRCVNDVTPGTVLYHYTSTGEWVEVSGGTYARSGKFITYDNITEFSGYIAADMTSIGGYNYPIVNTDTPSGPHGQYTSASNRCKDCHAGHRALGMYRLTRADVRGEACDFCHGVGGAASTTVILDAEGHGLSASEIGATIVAPGDTDPAYSASSTMWGCLECHSVHNNQTIQLEGFTSNKLLKSDPNEGKTYLYYAPVVGESTQTISQWCSTCHNANFGAAEDIQNKLVPLGALTGRVASHPSSGAGITTDTSGDVAVSLDDGVNNGPTCKECHPSDGGDIAVTAKFPHTSGSTPSMLKAGSSPIQVDNTCVGCHRTPSLN